MADMPGAAVLLGKLDAHQSERGQLRNQLGRKVLRLVPLPDVRADFGLGELAHRAPQQLLLLGQPEVHLTPSLTRRYCRAASVRRKATEDTVNFDRPCFWRNAT